MVINKAHRNIIINTNSDFYAFLEKYKEEIAQTEITAVYNLDRNMALSEDSPYILTEHHAIKLFCPGSLYIDIFPKRFFLDNLKGCVFHYGQKETDFDYINSSTEINCRIKKVRPFIDRDNGQTVFTGLDIILSNKQSICIRSAEFVPGTMDSWLEDS